MKFLDKLFTGDAMKKSIKKTHNDALQAYNKGHILLKMHRFEESIAAYDLAEQLWEEEIDILSLQGDHEAAKRSKSNFMNIWYGKTYANYMMGRYDASLELLEKTLEKAPDDPENLFRKGFVLYETHRYDEALVCLESALDKYIEFPEAWYCKGNVLRELGNYEAALEAFEHSISCSQPLHFQFPRFTWIPLTSSSRIKMDIAEAWYCKGEILFRKDNYEEALEAFNKSLEIKPGFEDAAKFRDVILQELGKNSNSKND
jgi:tetratricopeptide (TPR) repeat protein